jgi:hypothetical protein
LVSVGVSLSLSNLVIGSNNGVGSITQILAIQADNVTVNITNMTCTACVSAEVVTLLASGEHAAVSINGLRVQNNVPNGNPSMLQSVVRGSNAAFDNITVSNTNITCYSGCINIHGAGARHMLLRNVVFDSVAGGSTVLTLTTTTAQEGGKLVCDSCFLSGSVTISGCSTVVFVATVFSESKLSIERSSGAVMLRGVRWLPLTNGDAISIVSGYNLTVTIDDVSAVSTLFSRRVGGDFISFSTNVGVPVTSSVLFNNVNCTAFTRLVSMNQPGSHDVSFTNVLLNGTSLIEALVGGVNVRMVARNIRSTGALRGQLIRFQAMTNATIDNLLLDLDGETPPLGQNTHSLFTVTESCESLQFSNWTIRGVPIAMLVSIDLRFGAAVKCALSASQFTLRNMTTNNALFLINRNITINGLTISDSRLSVEEAIRFTASSAAINDVTLRNVTLERPLVVVRNAADTSLRRWSMENVVMRSPATPLLSMATSGTGDPERFELLNVNVSNTMADRLLRIEANAATGSMVVVRNLTATNFTASSELIRVTSTPHFVLTRAIITRCTSPAMVSVDGVANVTLSRVSIAHFNGYAIDTNNLRNLTITDLAVSSGFGSQGGLAAPVRLVRVAATLIERALISGNNVAMAAPDSCGGVRFEATGDTGTIVLRDMVFERNRAVATGALSVSTGLLTMVGCRFVDNVANQPWTSGPVTGAVFLQFVTGTVNDSTFVGNVAATGGAMHTDRSKLLLSGLRVWDNVAVNSRGGGLLLRVSTVAIDSSLLRNNSARDAGGGIAVTDTLFSISNSDIIGSVTGNNTGKSVRGGAIDVDFGDAEVKVVNTTVIGTRMFGTNDWSLGAVAVLSGALTNISDACFCDSLVTTAVGADSVPTNDLSCRSNPPLFTSRLVGSSSVSCGNLSASVMTCAGPCPLRVPILTTEAPSTTTLSLISTSGQPLTLPPLESQSDSSSQGMLNGTSETGVSMTPTVNDLISDAPLNVAVLGGAIGGGLAGLLLIGVGCCFARRRRQGKQQDPAPEVASVGSQAGDTVVTAESVSTAAELHRGTEMKPPIYSLLPSRTIDAGYDETGNLEAMQ